MIEDIPSSNLFPRKRRGCNPIEQDTKWDVSDATHNPFDEIKGKPKMG